MDLLSLRFDQHRINALGELVEGPFLQYILNLNAPLTTYSYDEYAAVQYSKERVEVLENMERIVRECGAANASNPALSVSDYIARLGMDNVDLYNKFRDYCGGDIANFSSTNQLEHFTLQALIKTYPSLLISTLHHPKRQSSHYVYQNDDLEEKFCKLLQADPYIASLINIEEKFVRFAYLLENGMMITEFQGSVLASFLRRCFFNCAYRMDFSIRAVAQEVSMHLDTLRDIGRKEEIKFSLFTGLYGIKFEGSGIFGVSEGWTVRTINSRHVPVSDVKKTYSILNDMPVGSILEIGLTSKGKLLPKTYSTSYGFAELTKKIDNFKLALIFATSSAQSPFERTFIDYSIPCYSSSNLLAEYFQHGIIVPQSAFVQVREWFEVLNNADLSEVTITVKRLQLALFQRRDVEDAIIDAFIAWEGMFNAKFETTFQLCATIAKFLKPTVDERKTYFERLKKLYALRSELAHGSNDQPKLFKSENSGEVRTEILMIGIECLKKLLKDPNLLKMSPSNRVQEILLR